MIRLGVLESFAEGGGVSQRGGKLSLTDVWGKIKKILTYVSDDGEVQRIKCS
jgi:hypothetical protein